MSPTDVTARKNKINSHTDKKTKRDVYAAIIHCHVLADITLIKEEKNLYRYNSEKKKIKLNPTYLLWDFNPTSDRTSYQ